MNATSPEKIRNVALVGHHGSGKTTLAEALLFRAGLLNRRGRVEDRNTVCDFEPEEHEKGFSLSLALAPFEWEGHKVNLIDTPGYADYASEVHAAMRVADLLVFVVSAVDGVEVQTERFWREAEARGLPRMVFVNKLDRERADFERTLDQLRDRFGAGVAPLELPIGAEAAFHGVADLLTDRAYLYDSGHGVEADIPDEMESLEHQVHDNLVEGIVVADDELLERYLDGDVPSAEELERTLAKGVFEASVFPVVCGSAAAPVGVDRLATFICEVGPSPLDRPPVTVAAGGHEVEVVPDGAADPLAFVFKTEADPYVGRISLFRVLSGTIQPDQHLINPRSGQDERLHGIFTLRGKEQHPIPSVSAGDIAAVAKLADTRTGDTLAPKGKPVVVPPLEWPQPVLAVAIHASTQSDEDKLANGLHRLLEEDPALVMERSDETHQTLLKGQGETHLQMALDKLQRKFGVAVSTDEVRVPYRETITATGEAEGKHKKQTGGHGQFAVCNLTVEPLERGAGYEFVDRIVGGAIPRQFIPHVEKGVEETMAKGGVFGYPVVDVRVTCHDGRFHAVDSSEMAFKMAARVGFREAMAKAEPVLLEPISHLEVTVPNDLQGDVMGDLNARRGRVQGTDLGPHGDQVIVAEVPTAELLRYAIDLRSITGGRGAFLTEHSHYDVVPAHLVDTVRRDRHDDDA